MVGVRKVRSIEFGKSHPRLGGLSINDLDEFTSGLDPNTSVEVDVSIIEPDRPGESRQVKIKLSVQES